MIVKLLNEHHLEYLSLKGDCTGSSESTLDKMPHCWKSHVVAQLLIYSAGQESVSLSFFTTHHLPVFTYLLGLPTSSLLASGGVGGFEKKFSIPIRYLAVIAVLFWT